MTRTWDLPDDVPPDLSALPGGCAGRQLTGWGDRYHLIHEAGWWSVCMDCGHDGFVMQWVLCPLCHRPVCGACWSRDHVQGPDGGRLYCLHPSGNRI